MKRLPRTAWVVCMFVPRLVFGAPGDLDPAFGINGRARIELPAAASVTAAALQADGKIVVVGTTNQASPTLNVRDVLVARLNGDGSLDTTFDSDGFAVIDFGNSDDNGAAVSIGADGRILVTGWRVASGLTRAIAARLNTNGSLDASFGQGGRASYFASMGATAIASQPDGRHVLAGGTPNHNGTGDLAFFRIDAAGAIDPSFGTSGITVVDFDQSGDDLVGIVRLPDGSFVAVGNSSRSGGRTLTAVRLLSTGALDSSNGTGKSLFSVGSFDFARSIHLQSDGKLLVAGTTPDDGLGELGMLVRLDAAGLDAGFGSGGRIVRADPATAVTSDASGRIYFAGDLVTGTAPSGRSTGIVYAVDADGAAATGFLPSGFTLIDAGHAARPSAFTTFAMLRLADGRLLVLGTNDESELLATRLLLTGGHPGVISIMPASSDVPAVLSETRSEVAFRVQRSGGSAGVVTVDYAAASATATAGTDFAETTGTLTWGDGESGTKMATLPIIDDGDYESGNEQIDLVLSAPTGGASLGTSVASVRVSSDEREAQLFPFGGSALESAGSITILVRRTGDARIAATARYAVTGVHATPQGDFVPVTGTLTWAPFDMNDKAIVVPILDDGVVETGEEIEISLSNPGAGTTFVMPSVRAMIQDDDEPRGPVTFERTSVLVNEGAGTVTVIARLMGASATERSFDIRTTPPDSATAGADYGAPSAAAVTWAAGSTDAKTITFPILQDSRAEATESFTVGLYEQTSGPYARMQVFIVDDDSAAAGAAARLSLNPAALQVQEGAGNAAISVNRSGNLGFPVSVEVVVNPGSALAGSDYADTPVTTLSWAAGEGDPKTVNIPIVSDTVSEPAETLSVSLRNPLGGASLGPALQTTITISNDDAPFSATAGFSEDAITIDEDAEFVDLPVTRTGTGASAVLLPFVSSAGTADAGAEFVVPRSARLVSPSDSVTPVRVWLNGDSRQEGDESFKVSLAQVGGALPLGRASITVTLLSDDTPAPPPAMQVAFTVDSISQAENQGVVNVPVSRSGSTTTALSVDYTTVAGTATAGADFVAASGTLEWAPGDGTDKTIAVTVTDDTAQESAETLTIRLSSPTNGATLGTSNVTISITDNDTAVPIPPSTPSAGGSGGGGKGAGDPAMLALLGAIGLLRHLARSRK